MAKSGIGSDWLYIGLGIGALYLVYKLGNPVKDIGEDVSSLTGSASTQGTAIVDTAGNLITSSGSILQKAVDYQSSWMDKLIQTFSPDNVINTITGITAGSKTSTAKSGITTKVTYGTDVKSLTNVSYTTPKNVKTTSVSYVSPTGTTYGTYTQNGKGYSGVIPTVKKSVFSK